MKRKALCFLAVLCLMLGCVLSVSGAQTRMVDKAGLLTAEERAQLEQTLGQISQRQGLEIVVVTVDSTLGKSPMEYADDFYDYGGYGTDGILLLISMEDGDWWVSTAGYGITAVTDAGLEYMSKKFVPYLSDGEYAQAFQTFAQLCDEFVTQAKTGDPYDTHNLPKDPFNPVMSLGLSGALGLAAAMFTTGSMKKKLVSVTAQAKADDYVKAGSLELTHSRDLFLYNHLQRHEKASSGGGSSTHTSSSGVTHGGGGGKF